MRIGKLRRMAIYAVDGERVRRELDVDFTMGGTHAVYRFIPKSEIWIDSCLGTVDRYATIVHEYVEHELMAKDGLSYDEAHDLSSEIESQFREKFTSRTANLKGVEKLLQTIP